MYNRKIHSKLELIYINILSNRIYKYIRIVKNIIQVYFDFQFIVLRFFAINAI
jgi:hypothetical protein